MRGNARKLLKNAKINSENQEIRLQAGIESTKRDFVYVN